MGREFTNALNETPLWQFALAVYPTHHKALLTWQDQSGANVNILLALAYGQQHQHYLPLNFQDDTTFQQLDNLTKRLRQLRKGLKTTAALYEQAKALELSVEGLQIIRLQQCLKAGVNDDFIKTYEKVLGIKKGALAPFINTLSY